MTHTASKTVPPVWQIGDVILDRYEVQQIFTDGGILRNFAEFVEGGPEQESLRSPVRRFAGTKASTSLTANAK